MTLPIVTLKNGKEKPIKQRHHWIFSGAIDKLPQFENGDLLAVKSHQGEYLGVGYFNRQAQIIGRMLTFDLTPPLEALKDNIRKAVKFRKALFSPKTNAYRLINGEGDFIPGLIVDQYDSTLVIQFSTLGMEKLRTFVIEALKEYCFPYAIYEKSVLPTRREEGLQDKQGWILGSKMDGNIVSENGLKFYVDIEEGQKTGFFLDQREMRAWVRELSHNKRVLNMFCYTGGFSVYAMAGNALQVDSVDISAKAIQLAKQNALLNGYHGEFIVDDAFKFLRDNHLQYDLIILDPPAFAKRQKDVIAACRGYKDINRIAMEKMPASSYLMTCSCSYHVDEQLFRQVLFQAAVEARRKVRIVGKHRQAMDHPINIYHPEGEYLKSFLLFIE